MEEARKNTGLASKCATCGDESKSHEIEETDEYPPKFTYGACNITGCKCKQFATGFGQSIQINE